MGADGFLWVRWVVGARGNTKTRQAHTKNEPADHNFDAMAGEISPDMMFWMDRQKILRMCTDGYGLVWICEVGLMDIGGTRNNKIFFENACIVR